MILLALVVSYILYHIIIFSYAEILLEPKENKWRFRIWTCIFNGIILFTYYYFRVYEAILFIIFPTLLYLEFKVGFEGKHLKSFFGSLCFAVNFFAVRLVLKSLHSIMYNVSFYESTQNIEINMLCTIGSFVICSVSVLFFRYFLTNRYINIIKGSEENIKFASHLLFFMYLFEVFNTSNLYVKESYNLLPLLQLKIGVCLIVGFLAAIFYAYLLSKLLIFRDTYEEMEDQMVEQQKESEALKNIAYIDQDLGCYSRTYGMLYLEETIEMNLDIFSVIFFDLDNLKIVNDKYGHYEGDNYIGNVVKVFKTIFKDFAICRMGGDEFMVVLRGVNEFDAYKYALKACERIEKNQTVENGKYNMSVSYGLVEISQDQKLSSERILKIVDEKMYMFKNSRKKARFK